MANTARNLENIGALYVDMGTTNTRVWVMRGDRVLASVTERVGIRDSARDGTGAIRKGLRELIAKALEETKHDGEPPEFIVASGMVGSNLGLAEVPYIGPPAGIEELTASARWHHFPDVSELPVLLIPGIRSGPSDTTPDSISEVDVMRGEETLCAGLVRLGLAQPPGIVLNLGSHWKAIKLNQDGRIESSVTSLSGELLHMTQAHTVLAGSLPSDRPETLSPKWIKSGMKEEHRSGLARTLFCARLLDLTHQGNKEDRFAFVVGAFVAADLDSLLAGGMIESDSSVALVGHSAVSQAWQIALSQRKIAAAIIHQKQAEDALLEALRYILVGALPLLKST